MTLAFHVSVVFVVACFVCQKQLIFFKKILFVGRAHFPCGFMHCRFTGEPRTNAKSLK